MKIIKIHVIIIKIKKNHRNQCEGNEHQESLRNHCENNKNHENPQNPYENNKKLENISLQVCLK